MSIVDMLDIKLDKREVITLIGAGGKTTTMFTLAKELKLLGKRVLITTTTAIFYPHRNQYDDIIIAESCSKEMFIGNSSMEASAPMSMVDAPKSMVGSMPGIVVFGRKVNTEGKLLGASKEDIDTLFKDNLFDFILVEGDGSRGKPIKAPAEHEPVIPSATTKIVGIIGMDAFGEKINSEYVHRPEIFCTITNSSMDDVIDVENIIELISNKNGLYKNTPLECEKYLLFNKVDADKKKHLEALELIKSKIMNKPEGRTKISSIAIKKICIGYFVMQAFENVNTIGRVQSRYISL
jgi:probable selenium-dependent hydroxylase accessory protein YqeC